MLTDTATGWADDCRRYRTEGFSDELLEFDEEMKAFEERWGRFEQALVTGIPNVWSRFAVGVQVADP